MEKFATRELIMGEMDRRWSAEAMVQVAAEKDNRTTPLQGQEDL